MVNNAEFIYYSAVHQMDTISNHNIYVVYLHVSYNIMLYECGYSCHLSLSTIHTF